MNITALSTSAFTSVSRAAQAVSTSTSGAQRSAGPATVPQISPQPDMRAELSALKSSDPEKFQATLQKMARSLRTAAKEHSGESANFLNGLADRATQAAQTGDLSVLSSPAEKRGASHDAHGGPPPGPRGAPLAPDGSSASNKEASTDAADTNDDGTVSAAEKANYALTHPSAAASAATRLSTSDSST